MIKLETVKAATLGLAIADAVGVPVEFVSRTALKKHPVTDMLGYGSHNQPPGTWSDDTSLAVATMESISRLNKIDYADIMKNFLLWYSEGKFTAFGEAFDIGNTTYSAIYNYSEKIPVEECGITDRNSNGNGSLMRILPAILYLYGKSGKDFGWEELKVVHKVSALTHAHAISLVGCGIYALIVAQILDGKKISESVQVGSARARELYTDSEFETTLKIYSRLWQENFASLPEDDIKSRGYVVDTLEAAIWCLLNTADYKSLVLKAVNLGKDTDTVAAVAGGAAGIYYGLEGIPEEWKLKVQKREYLEEMATNFFHAFN